MFDIPLISCQIDSQSQQLDSPNIGMRVQDQLDDIIHTICVGKSVSNSCLGRQ